LGTNIPLGYRAVWEERADLVAAKLAGQLTSATSETVLAALLFHPGSTRKDDDYIEIAIYADPGIDTDDVDRVTVQRAPMNSEETHRCQLVREICVSRSIVFIE
jgi:hypothetical protein